MPSTSSQGSPKKQSPQKRPATQDQMEDEVDILQQTGLLSPKKRIKFDRPSGSVVIPEDNQDMMSSDGSEPSVPAGRTFKVPELVTATSYQAYLKKVANKTCLTLRELTANRTPQIVPATVYALIKIVTEVPDSSIKKLVLYDPTYDNVRVSVSAAANHIFTIGNIVKMKNIEVLPGLEFRCELDRNGIVSSIQTLTYDFEGEVELFGFQERNFVDAKDKPIARALEQFLADKLLSVTLSQLPPPCCYFDICGQVIAQRKMVQSIVISLWDGTVPRASISDPYNASYQAKASTEYVARINEDYYAYAKPVHAVNINVWRNSSNIKCEHYETAAALRLLNGDDLLAIFNVELSRAISPSMVNLTLRSGRHQGKAVRKVARTSVLGRALMARITREVNSIKTKLGLSVDTGVEHASSHDLGQAMSSEPEYQETSVVESASQDSFLEELSAERTSTPVRRSLRIKANSIQIADSPEIHELLSLLPPYISFETIKDMEEDELQRYLDIVDQSDLDEFGPQIEKSKMVEIIRLAMTVKKNYS